MGLDLWFRDDVRRLLLMASRAADRLSGDFRLGYLAAVSDLAVGFGVQVIGVQVIGVQVGQVIDADFVGVLSDGQPKSL